MNGAPRCQKCGSWNTILLDADYATNLGEKICLTGFLGLPIAAVWAALDKSLKVWKCQDCGTLWRQKFL
jgi:hypothetical protein